MQGFIFSKNKKELLFSDDLKEDLKPILEAYGESKLKEKFVFIILNENNDEMVNKLIKSIKSDEQ